MVGVDWNEYPFKYFSCDKYDKKKEWQEVKGINLPELLEDNRSSNKVGDWDKDNGREGRQRNRQIQSENIDKGTVHKQTMHLTDRDTDVRIAR